MTELSTELYILLNFIIFILMLLRHLKEKILISSYLLQDFYFTDSEEQQSL